MRQLLSVFCLLLLAVIPGSTASGQENSRKRLDPTLDPREAARIEDLVPREWTIQHRALGDLNGDYTEDLALILFPVSLKTTPDLLVEHPQPALVIAFGTERGRWRLAGINNRLIFSDDTGFAPLRLEIKKMWWSCIRNS